MHNPRPGPRIHNPNTKQLQHVDTPLGWLARLAADTFPKGNMEWTGERSTGGRHRQTINISAGVLRTGGEYPVW